MLKKIAPDKWKHFYVGILMGAILQAFAMFLLRPHLQLATALTFIAVAGISYGFELFSLVTGHGHYDVKDAIASVVGGVVGMAISYFILLLY
ncbi:MAG: hypothetical protein ABIN57_03070 [Chitinophagaceae bacterium]